MPLLLLCGRGPETSSCPAGMLRCPPQPCCISAKALTLICMVGLWPGSVGIPPANNWPMKIEVYLFGNLKRESKGGPGKGVSQSLETIFRNEPFCFFRINDLGNGAPPLTTGFCPKFRVNLIGLPIVVWSGEHFDWPDLVTWSPQTPKTAGNHICTFKCNVKAMSPRCD